MKLKVWHIPQVPGKAFEVEVRTLREARLLLDALAHYDLFQLEHNIKGDYANVGGLVYYDEDEQDWLDWEHPEDGIRVEELSEEQIERLDRKAATEAVLAQLKEQGLRPLMTADEVIKLTRE